MNILLVAGPGITLKEPFSSGVEAFIVSLANNLVARGNTVDVMAKDADENAVFNVINPLKNAKLKWLQAHRFKMLDLSNYDVIHFNMYYPHLIKAGLRSDTPAAMTLHTTFDKTRARTFNQLTKHANMKFIAVSERMKSQWQSALNSPIELVQNGVDLEKWYVRKGRTNEYLLWSARIKEEKNPSAAIALAKHTGNKLKIAGRISDQKYYNAHVAPFLDNKIEYVGHVKRRQMSELSRNAKAFLATATWKEPFGLSALEMLASGVPVIGFESAILPDWKDASVAIADSNDWHDLIEPLGKVERVTPQQCRSFAASMSINKMTRQYEETYQRMSSLTKRTRSRFETGVSLENIPTPALR